MTPEDAYNEWMLLFGYREVPYKEIVNKGLDTIGRFLSSEGYLKHYPETKFLCYQLKQRHEIVEKYAYAGEVKGLTEWSRDSRCVVSANTLWTRVVKYKFGFAESLITPKGKLRK